MENYHIVIDGLTKGPFSFDELKTKQITPTTLVWTEKIDNWTEAKNIEELNSLIKKVPPPIPLLSEKRLKIEAEISRKKEKLITQQTEIAIAKETKVNFKLIFFALLVGAISYPISFTIKDGFDNQRMVENLNSHKYLDTDFFDRMEKLKKLEYESKQLGYRSFDKDFYASSAILYHERQYKKAAEDSFNNALIVALISGLILISIRYIGKGAKWVEETSKKQV